MPYERKKRSMSAEQIWTPELASLLPDLGSSGLPKRGPRDVSMARSGSRVSWPQKINRLSGKPIETGLVRRGLLGDFDACLLSDDQMFV